MIDKAITFASSAHKGSYRKGLKQPYIFHPLEVLSLVSLVTDDEDTLCAAVLHDTVEDTPVTIDDIKKEFNEHIASMVANESEDKRGNVNKANTWVDRKKEAIECLKNTSDRGSKIVALADKVSNLRSFHMLLLAQGEDAWNNFNMKDPKMHYWYYNGIKQALSDLSDTVIYKEYCSLIDIVFSKYLKESNDEE